ncbi:MAG: protein phosphatase 2C domain-containing protein [Polyangiaceae bacterium]
MAAEHGVFLKAYGATDRGRIREYNEDVVLVVRGLGLFAVADGAGGHEAGDVAADAAARALTKHIETHAASAPASAGALAHLSIDPEARLLSAAFHRAHRDVVAVARAARTTKGMGTTLVATYFSEDGSRVHIAHVGDSRCYRLRGEHLEAMTVDHSIGMDLLEKRPDLDDKVLGSLPRHVVTRAIGMGDDFRVSVQTRAVVLGDRYLLCSDGISSFLPAWELAEVMRTEKTPDAAVSSLIARANAAGGQDNMAAVVIDCTQGAAQAIPIEPPAVRVGKTPIRSSDPELLILGIEDLDLSGPTDAATDDLIRALGLAVKKHRK